jgi:hypothetical protein
MQGLRGAAHSGDPTCARNSSVAEPCRRSPIRVGLRARGPRIAVGRSDERRFARYAEARHGEGERHRTLIVLAAAAIGIDYGAAALTESVVAQQMRTQLGLADDPSVRINNFPFLTQAISGRYRSVDVTADHIAVGARVAGRGDHLLELGRPRVGLAVDAEDEAVGGGHAGIGAPDVERLVREAGNVPVDKLYIDGIDADAPARSTTARTSVADARPRHGRPVQRHRGHPGAGAAGVDLGCSSPTAGADHTARRPSR